MVTAAPSRPATPQSQRSQPACSVATTSAGWSSEKEVSESGAVTAMKTAAATPRIMTLPAPSRLLHKQPRNHEESIILSFSCFRVFVCFVVSCLEHEPQRELHHARVAREARDRCRRGVADVGLGQPELGRVEQVEDLPTQLNRRLTDDREAALHG